MKMTSETATKAASQVHRPVENEGNTQLTPQPNHDASQCKPARHELGKQSEVFWRHMFEEIGVRKKIAPPPPKTWKDRLACIAVIFLAAVLASQFGYRCYMDYHYGFEWIDTANSQLLREVMFGGKPWVVLCRWPNKRPKVPEAIDRSRIELLKVTRLGRIDCAAILPSGVTFAERFRIPSTTEGLILANGKAPRLLTPWALETKKNLLSYVERHTKLDIRTVDDNGSLARRCLTPAGGRCLMLLRHGGISTSERNKNLQQLFGDDPSVRKLKFSVVDTKKHQLKLHDAIPLAMVADPAETQLVCCVNTTPREKVEELAALRRKDDVSRHSFTVRVYDGSFRDVEAVKNFARSCASAVQGTEGFVDMPLSPTVSRL